ncbi:unnamed protein product [Didymodactylos carnosus]|uniref:C2 NT-type domain-containing protein n=1 Tax=Didymodactylos carnosus TaxID=1234261 RepID=A0A814K245_9BILA|nr:unnamed protein product [Didymodactylos carnosus]CAF1045743.1 unnamed protein product [Didymodactylos carnosus]CAF3629028.1 unnamed protein product [Didymodactylos carnosus]CAF3815687.1 unnamed protein product [Didymodactylos carnosus]
MDGDEKPDDHWSNFLSFQKKKRFLFNVELEIIRVVSMPYNGGKFFFKIRLLNGGNHTYTCDERYEINENKVEIDKSNRFSCKMYARTDTLALDSCMCRISIRKESRIGKGYEKIGYYDLDLASYAGCGKELKACLLYAYESQKNNPANAYLEIRISCTMKENETITDPLFRRPYTDPPYIRQIQPKNDTNIFNSQIDSEIDVNDPTDVSMIQTQLSQTQKYYPGHSRQTSKGSVKSFQSTYSASTNPLTVAVSPTGSMGEKCHQSYSAIGSLRNESRHLHNSHSDPNIHGQASDDSIHSMDSIRKVIKSRRAPYIEEFGDIQRRLHATRVDANEVVDTVMLKNAKTIEDTEGFLRLIYNKDGSTRVGTGSKLQQQSSTNSLFVA